MKSIVEYYYMWKSTDRYVQQASCELCVEKTVSAIVVLLTVSFFVVIFHIAVISFIGP